MSTTIVKWIDLASCISLNDDLIVPTGINKDNFIVLEYDTADLDRINFIYKYNIHTNKWTTTDLTDDAVLDKVLCGSNDLALDAKQNVLYFFYQRNLMQFELNSKKMTKYILPSSCNHDLSSKCVVSNDELFVISGEQSHSISKWNKETKELISIGSIYNKIPLDLFGLICDNRSNNMLFFGGYDNINFMSVDHILQYNTSTNQCNKLAVSLPERMSHICALKVINN
eukprot:77211_1